jgi:hypothetical protein
MLAVERQKKLAYAEKQLNATQRRLKRLMTAQRNWTRKVKYHRDLLQWEAELAEATAVKTAVKSGLSVSTTQGRKFR